MSVGGPETNNQERAPSHSPVLAERRRAFRSKAGRDMAFSFAAKPAAATTAPAAAPTSLFGAPTPAPAAISGFGFGASPATPATTVNTREPEP